MPLYVPLCVPLYVPSYVPFHVSLYAPLYVPLGGDPRTARAWQRQASQGNRRGMANVICVCVCV